MSNNEESGERKRKSRKKLIYQKILQQMEFYFSPSNLAKDRWISSQLMENDDICLTEFLRFNKIRALTDNVNDLAKALEKSDIITVNENMRVKRTAPVQLKKNEDDYVIYVEQVPPDADHEWLKGIFSVYGDIDYVSIPRFKNSKKCKGFAFVEFAKSESVQKAMEDFKERGNYLSTDIAPEELLSIKTHESDDKGSAKEAPTESEAGSVAADDSANQRKRKISEGDGDEVPEEKKTKFEPDDESATDQDCSAAEEAPETEECGKTKKKKNRKKKNKKKKTRENAGNVGLQILTKRDWKRLRNKYLNMQKEKMKQLKKYLFAQRRSDLSKRGALAEEQGSGVARGRPAASGGKGERRRETTQVEFEKGLIVKIKFDEPVIEVKNLKNEIKKNDSVKFVEAKEGQSTVYVRFEGPDAASTFCQNTTWPEPTVLTGHEEEDYWVRLQKERSEKLAAKATKKGRGKDKLMKKAETILGKHIIFEEI